MDHQEQLRRFAGEMHKIRESLRDNINMEELFNEDIAQLIHVLARIYSVTPNAMLMSLFFMMHVASVGFPIQVLEVMRHIISLSFEPFAP